MKTVFKILKKVVLIGLGVYAALFAVFFFGKALLRCGAVPVPPLRPHGAP